MNIEDVSLKLGNNHVPMRLFIPNGADKTYAVLWLQGWSASMDSHREGVARMANATHTVFATLDTAGHGLHTLPLEQSTRKQQHEEVVAVFDELQQRGFDKIIVVGGSFGGYLAALLTGTRPVCAVVLRAPAIYDDAELELPHAQTRKWHNPDRDQQDAFSDSYIQNNEAVRSIHNFDGFTYVLEHELDEQVPKVMPRTYFENAKHGNYLIIPKTEHSPKNAKNPQAHFAYIEHFVIAIIEAVKLQANL